MNFLALGIVLLVFLATGSFVLARSDPSDYKRPSRTLVILVASTTMLGSIALGLGAILYLIAYEPEPYYGSYIAPVFTCIAAIVVSLAGFNAGMFALLVGPWRGQNETDKVEGSATKDRGRDVAKRDIPTCFEPSGARGWTGLEACHTYLRYKREASPIPDVCLQCPHGALNI